LIKYLHKYDTVCAPSRRALRIHEDHRRHPIFFTPTGDAYLVAQAVNRSGVCWKTCLFLRHTFALGRPITIAPAPPFFPCVLFPKADSFSYSIVVCRAFDPRPLVDLVCVSPRVVSTLLFLDIVDLVVTLAALRSYAPFIAPVDWWTVVLCHHRARVSQTRFCTC
jgi:hypothetical protein